MRYCEPCNALIFQLEMVRVKLELKNHYLKVAAGDIYENSGQLLNLIRLQLFTINSKINQPDCGIEQAGKLIAEVITNLRDMSKGFYPEVELASARGLAKALDREMNDRQGNNNQVVVKGVPRDLSAEIAVLFFHAALEMLELMKEQKSNFSSVQIIYSKAAVRIRFRYFGNAISFYRAKRDRVTAAGFTRLTIAGRIALVGGKLRAKKISNQENRIDIIINGAGEWLNG